MRRIFLFLTMTILSSAQTKINPINSINWPLITGNSPSPTLSCNSTNYGQPYQDIAVTPNVSYVCGTNGWQVISSGSTGILTSFTTGNLVPLFTSALGANPLTTPALAFTPSNAAQNSFLAGPSTGGAGVYTFRIITDSDLPSALTPTTIKIGSSSVITGASGTGITLVSTSGTATAGHIATWTSSGDIADSGTVLTNVALKNTTNSFTSVQTLSSLILGGSSTITGVQGSTGTLLSVVTGNFFLNDLRSTDANGNEIDSGISATSKQGSGSALMSTIGSFTQGDIMTVNSAGTLVDSSYLISNIPFTNQSSTFTGDNTFSSLTLGNYPGAVCTLSTTGLINYIAGGTGIKDTVQVCAKDASNTYAFRTIY